MKFSIYHYLSVSLSWSKVALSTSGISPLTRGVCCQSTNKSLTSYIICASSQKLKKRRMNWDCSNDIKGNWCRMEATLGFHGGEIGDYREEQKELGF